MQRALRSLVVLILLAACRSDLRAPRASTAESPDEWVRQVEAIVADHSSWRPLEDPVAADPIRLAAPGDRARRPHVGRGDEGSPHAGLLFFIDARDPDAYRGVESGAPQTGQVVVLRAFEPRAYSMPGLGRMPADAVRMGGRHVIPGRYAGMCVMQRIGETWRYARVAPGGAVQEVGALASCRECHERAPCDGLFGIDRLRTPLDVVAPR